jgi:Site-specific recombinase XerD
MLQENNVRQGFFEREQFEAVKEKLRVPLQAMITFAYITGWRVPSEVLKLQWTRIDRETETIRLEPGEAKNRDGRTFPYEFLPALRDVLETQWTEHERLLSRGRICPFVFHRNEKPIRSFGKAWKTACQGTGVPGRVPHDFRRTAVRNLVRAGVSERTAILLTGHKTRSVFDRYDIVNEQDLRDATRKLALAGTKRGQSSDDGGSVQEAVVASA